MSEVVTYKGKLILCKKYKNANELITGLQDFWKSIPIEERNKYYKDVEEIEADELENNGYVIIDGNCIYKVELDENHDIDKDFVLVVKTQPGIYEFVTQFYNGGTYLQEMLQEGFDELKKGKENHGI